MPMTFCLQVQPSWNYYTTSDYRMMSQPMWSPPRHNEDMETNSSNNTLKAMLRTLQMSPVSDTFDLAGKKWQSYEEV